MPMDDVLLDDISRNILQAIEELTSTYRRPPIMKVIGDHLNLNKTTTINKINLLVKKGFVKKLPNKGGIIINDDFKFKHILINSIKDIESINDNFDNLKLDVIFEASCSFYKIKKDIPELNLCKWDYLAIEKSELNEKDIFVFYYENLYIITKVKINDFEIVFLNKKNDNGENFKIELDHTFCLFGKVVGVIRNFDKTKEKKL